MKETNPCPRKRWHFRSEWLKGAAIVFVLGIILAVYAPSGSQGATKPTTTGQPTVMPQTTTQVSAPNRGVPQSAPAQGAKASAPAGGSPASAKPKDLPSKGAPGAKLVLVVFSEFH